LSKNAQKQKKERKKLNTHHPALSQKASVGSKEETFGICRYLSSTGKLRKCDLCIFVTYHSTQIRMLCLNMPERRDSYLASSWAGFGPHWASMETTPYGKRQEHIVPSMGVAWASSWSSWETVRP